MGDAEGRMGLRLLRPIRQEDVRMPCGGRQNGPLMQARDVPAEKATEPRRRTPKQKERRINLPSQGSFMLYPKRASPVHRSGRGARASARQPRILPS